MNKITTKQEAFDFSTRGIIAQGGPSYESQARGCRYRSGNKKCAFGQFLTDDLYRDFFEGKQMMPVMEYIRKGATFLTSWPVVPPLDPSFLEGIEPPFLNRLQAAHDFAASSQKFWKDWKEQLQVIVDTNKLDASVLAEIPKE